jgi:hypothetical protein
MTTKTTTKIFGYEWKDIQRAQQSGSLSKPITQFKPEKADATPDDYKLLAELGVDELRARMLFGVLDRLNLL